MTESTGVVGKHHLPQEWVAPKLLEASGITKRFAGITALNSVDLDVARGEMVGLIGPNGAGKTTLFNCLLGMLRPEQGTVVFDGKEISSLPVYKRARLGIGRTFQRLELFAGTTVRDHFMVAERQRNRSGRLWKDLLNLSDPTSEEMARVDAMIELLGLQREADRPVEMLSLGRGRLVELGRALMTQPTLLLLDEPSSGLDVKETAALAERLATVQQQHEFAVLLVEHDVEMVQSLVTRLYVLDFGTRIAAGPTDDVLSDAKVRKAYLGDIVGTRPRSRALAPRPAADRPTVADRCSSCVTSRRATARSARCSASRSPCASRRSRRCWAPTARGRRPSCGCAAGCSSPRAVTSCTRVRTSPGCGPTRWRGSGSSTRPRAGRSSRR
jgi:branched-chain amino acid transport system ATP-binding protein